MKIITLSTLILSSTLSFSGSVQAQPQYYQAPKPMTEGVLKQRLNAQLSFTKQQMAYDRQQANAYAAQFSRMQQQQAAALKQMMDHAEKQREYTLNRLEMQQQIIIEQFSKFQISQDKQK